MDTALPGSPSQLTDHVVQAGAGAGKTRSLVDKVVSVFRQYRAEGRVPRMVVTTFTRKATQELRERLILRACRDKDASLLDYVGNARSLHISTIHGVLNLFLSQVGHLCNLEAGFRVIHDPEERQVARSAAKRVLLANEEDLAWFEDYSFERLLTILIRFSKTLSQDSLLRPAEIGDLQHLHDAQIKQWKLDLRAVTNKILNSSLQDPAWSRFAEELDNFTTHWDGSSQQFESRPAKPRKSAKSALAPEFQDELADDLQTIKDDVLKFSESIELWPRFTAVWKNFENFGRRFNKEFWRMKMNEGLLSVSDLEIFSLTVLRDNPFLGGNFSCLWDIWLIDEYQDTSPIQSELLLRLRGQSPEFVVGDPQQSIYLFRGARSDIFHAKVEKAVQSGATVESLRVNYRSEPALLEFLNDFFRSGFDQFSPMQPRGNPESSTPAVAYFISGPTVADEDSGILAHIARLRASGQSFEDICVLGRTHSHLSSLAAVLKNRGIPVQVHSPTGFWRRREILDAVSLLKFLVHCHDNLNLLALLRSPCFRVPDDTLVTHMRQRPKSLWNEVKDQDLEAIARLRKFLGLRRELGVVGTFEVALKESALLDLAFHNDPAGRREANLWKLLARLKQEEKRPGFQILNFMEEVEEGLSTGEFAGEGDAIAAHEPNCVHLMTVHGSKGLEFEHVIIPRMGVAPNLTNVDDFSFHEENSTFTFPVFVESEGKTVMSQLDQKRLWHLRRRELAEQDRWLYVALTRAKQSVALCWCDDRLERKSWADQGRLTQADRFSRSSKYSVVIERAPFESQLETATQKTAVRVRVRWHSQYEFPNTEPEIQNSVSVSEVISNSQNISSIENLTHRQSAAIYGIDMHRAFQALKVRSDIEWAKRTYPKLAESLDYVWKLQNPPFLEILNQGQVEWGFKVKLPEGLVQGRIDLWGKSQDGKLWIVDYKSGRSTGDSTYWDQLRIYARALREFGHDEEIWLSLIHPTEKKTLIEKF